MRNFLYDLIATQPNVDGKYHGGGKYAKKIYLDLLTRLPGTGWTLYAVYDPSKWLDDEIKRQSDLHHITLLPLVNHSLIQSIDNIHFHRIYSALPSSLIPYGFFDLLETHNVYLTIHGLRQLEIKESINTLAYATSITEKIKTIAKIIFEARNTLRLKKRLDLLIDKGVAFAVSNHTKYSIENFFPHLHNKDIKVFYSPDVSEFDDTDDPVEPLPADNYFLMVSGNRWIKNNIHSAIALDQLFSERPDITQQVIITGVKNTSVYLKKIKNRERFIFLDYVNDAFLSVLYQNAFAFVYLSLNEGFGYPPLEAMKFGVPVIASPFTSITEICGDSVLYSNPHSIPELKGRVLQLLDKAWYNHFSHNGKRRYQLIRQKQTDDLSETISYLLS